MGPERTTPTRDEPKKPSLERQGNDGTFSGDDVLVDKLPDLFEDEGEDDVEIADEHQIGTEDEVKKSGRIKKEGKGGTIEKIKHTIINSSIMGLFR